MSKCGGQKSAPRPLRGFRSAFQSPRSRPVGVCSAAVVWRDFGIGCEKPLLSATHMLFWRSNRRYDRGF